MTGAKTLPWTRACFVCGQDNPHGLRLRCRLEAGLAVLEHTAREADLGWKTFVHGGITMALMDEVMAWAAMVSARRPCVTAEMTTRLRRPARLGMRLRAEGQVNETKARMVLTAARVIDEQGQELATASGKFVPMNPESAGAWLEDLIFEGGTLRPDELFAIK
ncbi:MAG: PaaI family thioesterase [Elusimicrobia bacterium]|nr:PaaI family thioesterase [Elusimicrobiota bacterium]